MSSLIEHVFSFTVIFITYTIHTLKNCCISC